MKMTVILGCLGLFVFHWASWACDHDYVEVIQVTAPTSALANLSVADIEDLGDRYARCLPGPQLRDRSWFELLKVVELPTAGEIIVYNHPLPPNPYAQTIENLKTLLATAEANPGSLSEAQLKDLRRQIDTIDTQTLFVYVGEIPNGLASTHGGYVDSNPIAYVGDTLDDRWD